jgi:hypothetical protein
VFEMASLLIEEESGTYTARFQHSHNGYYAGDFFQAVPSGPAHDTTSTSTSKETR